MRAGIPSCPRTWVAAMRPATMVLLGAALALAFACTRGSNTSDEQDEQDQQGQVRAVTGLETPPEASDCPSEPIPEARAPDVRPEHEQASYWLAKYDPATNNLPLLDEAAHAGLRERVAALPGGWRDPLGEVVGDPELIATELHDRLEWLRAQLASGKYVELEAGALERAAGRIEGATPVAEPNLHFVAVETPLWCVPMNEGLYTEPVDRDFDRNRCASLHPGEYLRALRASADGEWTYVDAGHSVGWIHQAARALEPGLSAAELRARLEPPRLYLINDHEDLRHGSSFPLVRPLGREGAAILMPGLDGPVERALPAEAPISEIRLPLSRRRVFEQAFLLLEQPYGWGGRDGQRDCSRYLYDLFALFEVRFPRNSAVQAELGTRSVDLSELDEAPKRAAIRAAAQTGVVLLYMPGHIMLYLGHDAEHDYGISALSEFLVPCPGGPDTVHRLDKVAVTTLELGRGSERRAFIERITKMAVFGPEPEPAPEPEP
jgi:hypothetical protein